MRFPLLAPSCLLLVALAPALAAADGAKPDKPDKADKIPKTERRELRKSGDGAADEKRPAPSDLQARLSSRLRERLEITDDAEWAVIAERITRVEELRRATASGPIATLDRAKRGGKATAPGRPPSARRCAARSPTGCRMRRFARGSPAWPRCRIKTPPSWRAPRRNCARS